MRKPFLKKVCLEVAKKVVGTQNPANLITKVLTTKEVEDRLSGMNFFCFSLPASHHLFSIFSIFSIGNC